MDDEEKLSHPMRMGLKAVAEDAPFDRNEYNRLRQKLWPANEDMPSLCCRIVRLTDNTHAIEVRKGSGEKPALLTGFRSKAEAKRWLALTLSPWELEV